MDEPVVTLTHEDIANITRDMEISLHNETKPTQGYLEYLLCRSIKKRKGIDFSVASVLIVNDVEKPETLGDILRSYLEEKSLTQENERG